VSISGTRRNIAGIALPFVVAGCGILGGGNLPTHRDWGGESPATPEAGQLVLSGDCVSLVSGQLAETWLVVWPPGTSRSGPDIVGSDGLELARVGDDVSLDGGEYDAVEVVSQLATPIPSACQTDRYWLVANVTVDSRPSASP
jgi:hypothetical protein